MNKGSKLGNFLFTVLTLITIAALGWYIVWVVRNESTGDRPLREVVQEISPTFAGMAEGNEGTLKRLYGITGQECGEYILYSAESMMDVEEMLIVKVNSDAALDLLEKAVQKRLDTQLKKFNGYGTTQTALLNAAVTAERGNWFFFAVHKDADLWQDRFLSAIR